MFEDLFGKLTSVRLWYQIDAKVMNRTKQFRSHKAYDNTSIQKLEKICKNIRQTKATIRQAF